MTEDSETVELKEIYQQADAEGRKKIAIAAEQLMKAQKSLAKTPDDNTQAPEQNTAAAENNEQ